MSNVTIVEELLITEKNYLESKLSRCGGTVRDAELRLEEAQKGLAYTETRYAEVIQSLSKLEAL